MCAKKTITRIDEFNQGLVEENRLPVLLACISKDDDLEWVIHILEHVGQRLWSRIEIFLAIDDLVPFFMEKYGFEGTPSYILIQKGMPPEYMFGDISEDDLFRFTGQNLINNVARGKP
ncbi:MAG: hypothetical protein U9P80_10605 [Thermodesulfobacteriota bacterium]|nr:hypothetical protein [Thermodesulfobacteriota bacterium]